jgi:hypothetical protein
VAARVKRDAGALDAACGLLVAVEAGPPDGLRTAEDEHLRGQIAARAAGHGRDGPQAHGRDARRAHGSGEADRDRLRAVYGERKFERLVALKTRYDPTNFLRLNQNIPPSMLLRRERRCM